MLDPYTNFIFEYRKALILLNLRVACVNLVDEVFECKSSLTFDGEIFAAFVKLRIEHMVQILACKVSATFVVQILKGIEAPLSLHLA